MTSSGGGSGKFPIPVTCYFVQSAVGAVGMNTKMLRMALIGIEVCMGQFSDGGIITGTLMNKSPNSDPAARLCQGY